MAIKNVQACKFIPHTKIFPQNQQQQKIPQRKLIACAVHQHRVLFLSLVVVAWLFLAFFYSRKKIIPRKKIKSICRKQKGKITTTVAAQKLHVCHSLYDERGTCHAMRFCSKIMNKNETQRMKRRVQYFHMEIWSSKVNKCDMPLFYMRLIALTQF